MLERHLAPGGYLFISHSESLNGFIARSALGGAGRLSAEGRDERRRPIGHGDSEPVQSARRAASSIGIGEFAVADRRTRRS